MKKQEGIILNVFTPDFRWKARIISYISLIWQESYNGVGGFTLFMDDNSASVMDSLDYLFIAGKKTAMIVLNKEVVSEQHQVMFSGYTTLYLLSKRIIRNTIKMTNAEAGMYALVQQNLRGLQRVKTAQSKGLTETHESERTWDELLIAVAEVSAATNLGIRMIFDRPNKQHVFEVYRGLDRRVTQNVNTLAFFGEEFRNIYSLSISDDTSNFKNVAIVAGGGEEEERAIVEVGTAQGDDRFELYVDARDLQPAENETLSSPAYLNRLRSRGEERLSDFVRRQNFKIDVDPADYGVKYNLGDLISCKSSRYGVQLSARIMEHSYVVEGNVQKTLLTVGDASLDAIGEVKIWRK